MPTMTSSKTGNLVTIYVYLFSITIIIWKIDKIKILISKLYQRNNVQIYLK
jgi:hypothetical protein